MQSGVHEGSLSLAEVVVRHDERIKDLEEWRKAVNGDLRAIRERIMWVGWGVAATLAAALVNLLYLFLGR